MTQTISKLCYEEGFRVNKVLGDKKGMELEANFTDGIDPHTIDDEWRVEGEGSLRGVGYEFITPGGFSSKDVKKKFKSLVGSRIFRKYRHSHRAGIHIHMNVSDWTVQQVYTFCMLYYAVEPVIVPIFGGENREFNLFCLQLHQADNITKLLRKLARGQMYGLKEEFQNYKYSALNLCSIARLGTLEMRFFKSTIDHKQVETWIDFIDALIAMSRTFKDPVDFWNAYQKDPGKWLKKMVQPFTTERELRAHLHKFDNNYSSLVQCLETWETRHVEEKGQRNTRHYRFPSEDELDQA